MPATRPSRPAPPRAAPSRRAPPRALALRQALGRFATGVAAIVRARANGTVCGMTINSFASLSLTPPLILWALARESNMFDLFAEEGQFSVNVLHARQRDLAMELAQSRGHELAPAQWQRGTRGAPVLTDALARFECRVKNCVAGGDHVIMVGAIEHFDVSRRPPRAALLFLGGDYCAL